MDARALRSCARLDGRAAEMLRRACEVGLLSARGEHRTVRVARTIADLGASARIGAEHMAEALAFRPDLAYEPARSRPRCRRPRLSSAACAPCRLRSGLLAELGAVLDLRARDRSRLVGLLALRDLELIDLLGGRRREELRRAHRDGRLRAGAPRRAPYASTIAHIPGDCALPARRGCCTPRQPRPPAGERRPPHGDPSRHEPAERLRRRDGPLAGERPGRARGAPSLACTRTASRGRPGKERSGPGAAPCCSAATASPPRAPSTPATSPPPRRASCLATELPPGVRGRRWGRLAAERTVVHLSDLVVVVESESAARAVRGRARPRQRGGDRGRAGQGHVTPFPADLSSCSASGAALVRSAEDVLARSWACPAARPPRVTDRRGLPTRLARAAQARRLGRGDARAAAGRGPAGADVLVELAELELMGLVRRTRDGRYVATAPGWSQTPAQARIPG